jgi:hypothetical protein
LTRLGLFSLGKETSKTSISLKRNSALEAMEPFIWQETNKQVSKKAFNQG